MVCRSRQALLQGLRPNVQQNTPCRFCLHSCIYCDIWKLGTLISTRKPLSQRYSWILSSRNNSNSNINQHYSASVPSSSSSSSSTAPDSPRLQETFDWEPTEHMIEAQFQTQRALLASIMSICTVDGVDECEGLRIAHARCLQSVSELLYQEKVLEETILRSAQASSSTFSSPSSSSPHPYYSYSPSYPAPQRPSAHRMSSRDYCSSANASYDRLSEQRPSCVEIAM